MVTGKTENSFASTMNFVQLSTTIANHAATCKPCSLCLKENVIIGD